MDEELISLQPHKEENESGDKQSEIVSSTNGEENSVNSYLAPYPPDAERASESEKLIDFDGILSSSEGNVEQPSSSENNVLLEQPDWGPYSNINNSTTLPFSAKHEQKNPIDDMQGEGVGDELTKTCDSSVKDKVGFLIDPVAEAPSEKPQYADKTVGDSACATWFNNVDPRVLDLIYWRDVRKTGAVFGSMMFILLSLTCCTILSVLSYLSLGILTLTLSFRAYRSVLQAVQKTGDQHPFREYLDKDLEYSRETVDKMVGNVEKHLNCTVKEVRRLFLVEDMIDSVKFFLLLWVLTYVGGWFSGMTILILGVVTLFSVPKLYEMYQVPIDNNMHLVHTQFCNIVSRVQDKVPFLKRKTKTQ